MIRIIILFLFSGYVYASACAAIFTGALQTHSSNINDTINFACGAKVIDSGTVLTGLNISNPNSCGVNTCTTGNCSASGTSASALDAGGFKFSDLSDGNFSVSNNSTGTLSLNDKYIGELGTVSVGMSSILNFTNYGQNTEYHIKNLNISSGSIINLVPGDYWIENFESNNINKEVIINVVGTGTARLFFANDMSFKKEAELNENGTPGQLFIYSYGNLSFDKDLNLKGFVYAQGDVNIKLNANILGAINALSIDVSKDAVFIYSDPSAIDFDDLCQDLSAATFFEINHDGVGVFCIEESITITAKNKWGIATAYTGTISLDAGNGINTWTVINGNGILTGNNYTFSNSDNGSVTLALLRSSGDSAVNIDIQEVGDSSIRDNDSEGVLNYSTSGLLITENVIPAGTTTIPAAYSKNIIAGVNQNMYLTAFGLEAGSSCGIISDYSGDKNINFTTEYVDPNTGTLNFNINNNGSGTQVVNFTEGSANISALYRDVGMVKLYATDSDTGTFGSTNSFVVKPAKFVINIPNMVNSIDHNGAVFKKAGENFTVNISVQDNDGNITPNYGNEAVSEGVVLTHSLAAPVGGNAGTLANYNNFVKTSAGIFTNNNINFSEVGIINLTAGVLSGNYLGTGNITGPVLNNIGRFTPDHFNVSDNNPSFEASCSSGGFSYLGQNILYQTQPLVTFTAKNANDITTQNYTGNYFKMDNNLSVNHSSNSPTATMTESITKTVSDSGQGVGTIAINGNIKFNKTNGVNISPFTAEVSNNFTVQDADGVVYNSNPYTINNIPIIGGSNIYQGRVLLGNVFGSELTALNVPLQLEYFNGSSYIVNTNDNCSVFSSSDITLTPYPNSLSSQATVNNISDGKGSITLSAPVNAVTGYVDVDLNLSAKPYLQHDWPHDDNADGNYNDDPRARATFGIYKGKDKIIHIKEVY